MLKSISASWPPAADGRKTAGSSDSFYAASTRCTVIAETLSCFAICRSVLILGSSVTKTGPRAAAILSWWNSGVANGTCNVDFLYLGLTHPVGLLGGAAMRSKRVRRRVIPDPPSQSAVLFDQCYQVPGTDKVGLDLLSRTSGFGLTPSPEPIPQLRRAGLLQNLVLSLDDFANLCWTAAEFRAILGVDFR